MKIIHVRRGKARIPRIRLKFGDVVADDVENIVFEKVSFPSKI